MIPNQDTLASTIARQNAYHVVRLTGFNGIRTKDERNCLFMNLKVKLLARKRTALRIVMSAALLILASFSYSREGLAQADFEKGYQGFQSYHGSDFDTVNLANGNLVLDIPLLSYEQRGGLPPVVISIRSNASTFQSTPPYVNGPLDTQQHEVPSGVIGAPWGQPHVSISPGGLSWKENRITTASKTAGGSPEYLTRFVAIDDSGATHSLGGSISNSTAGYVPGIRYSVDGSGLMLQPGTSATGPVLVDRKGNTGGLIDPNGNAIQLQGPCAMPAGSGDYFDASLPSWEGYAHGTASAKTITDSIGRVIPNPSYLPPVANYSCLVDLSASYHAATQNGTACGYASEGSALYSPEVQTPLYGETFYFPGEDQQNGLANNIIPLTFCYDERLVSAQIPQPQGSELVYPTINEKWWLLTSVTLPNGTSWSFTYDNFGQVLTVTMPTGATVTYGYGTRLACGNPPGDIPVAGTPVWPYSNIMASREVVMRTLTVPNGATQVWKYQYDKFGSGWVGGPPDPPEDSPSYEVMQPSGQNEGTVTVTDPMGNETVHTFLLQGGSTCGPYETETVYNQGASTQLKRVDTTYTTTGADYANPTNFSNYIAVGVFPNIVKTTMGGEVSQETYKYDSFGSYEDYVGETHHFSFGQVQSESEYDWGSGAAGSALRTTLHTKLWQSNWKYYAANLIDLPYQDTVQCGTTSTAAGCAAAGTQVSQTTYAYDESAYSYSGSLGNSTSVTRWLQGGTSPVTHNVYCSTASSTSCKHGMPWQKIDANGNTTTLTYDSSGLYLSEMQYPNTTANGQSVIHAEYFGYDDNTGELLHKIDENGNVTGYSYDSMRRVTYISFPDHGWEQYCFVDNSDTTCSNDSYSFPSFTYSKLISPGIIYFAVGEADGLGRMIHTQIQTTDPSGWINTDTTYDELGRVASVTNPYMTTYDSSFGTTYYTYDALNRKTFVQNPDNSTKQWCYNGLQSVPPQTNCNGRSSSVAGVWVDSADEAGNDWQRTTDALGRLRAVLEPNGTSTAPTMETDYNYDALSNLLKVQQWGGSSGSTGSIQRTFSYDSLSRLITSQNPEVTGTAAVPYTTYTYDPNGNVIEKGYPPPDNPAIGGNNYGAIMFYCYDALNRLTTKYVLGSGSCSSPVSSYISAFAYDGGLLPGTQFSGTTFANAIGQLTDEQQRSGTTLVSERSPYQFDTMERMLMEQQMPYAPSAASYTFTHNYDCAGNLTSTINSLTNINVGYGHDTAGRLSSVVTGLSGSNGNNCTNASNAYPSTLYKVDSYGAVGVDTASYGSNSPSTAVFNQFRYYDKRERVIDSEVYPLSDSFASGAVTIAGIEPTCTRGDDCQTDTGTVSVVAGAYTATYSYGGADDVTSIAAGLAANINQIGINENSAVTANVLSAAVGTDGPYCTNGTSTSASTSTEPCAVVVLTAISFGTYGDVSLSASVSPSTGQTAPFAATTSGSALTGGAGSPQGGNTAYAYRVIYSYNGNVVAANDPYNGSWNYTYDTLNRLTSGAWNAYQGSGVDVTTKGQPDGIFNYQCWAYDNFGNRTFELESTSACPSTLTTGTSTHWWAYGNANNQVTGSDNPLLYDTAGDVLKDALNSYAYDVEGRVCAVLGSGPSYTQYVYDAEGRRVAKGSIPSMPASGEPCAAPTAANGFTLTNTYLRGIDSDQDTELTSAGLWHTNVFASGELVATYDYNSAVSSSPVLSYDFEDWLGTKRMQSTAAGAVAMSWSSDPFGDYLDATGSATDATEQHFTGKERDAETGFANGNDYFGARYYSSSTGRFLSPDWSAKEEPVPYAKLDDPQSLNLYAYMRNNPLSGVDADGHLPLLVNPAVEIDYEALAIKFHQAVLEGQELIAAAGGGESVAGGSRWGLLAGPMIYLGAMIHPATVYAPTDPPEGHAPEPEPKPSSGGARKGGGLRRPYLRKDTIAAIYANALRNSDGQIIDPNTREVIEGKPDIGHVKGHEFWREKARAEEEGLSQKQFNDRMNDAKYYQLEDRSSNRSRKNEQKP